VKDAQGDPAYGRTNWRRFAVAVGVPTVAAAGLVFGLANGAFAASLTLSGQAFKIQADQLVGDGFVQYSQVTQDVNGKPLPLAISGISHATLYNLCQSVHPDKSPVSLTIRAGKDHDHPAVADNLLIGLTDLSGDATFTNIDIGLDASTTSKAGQKAKTTSHGFAQEADRVVIDGLKQTAYSTQAGTFKLTGLSLKINTDFSGKNAPDECY
jgi:Family of unknown function (DUF6230)